LSSKARDDASSRRKGGYWHRGTKTLRRWASRAMAVKRRMVQCLKDLAAAGIY
jgi:hypothetical protein